MPLAQVRTFSYNNVQQPDWLLINKASRPMFSPVEAVTMDVPGRRGAYFFETRTGSKQIKLDITIMAESDNDLWRKIEYLGGWLDQGKPLPLAFNDEPERFYMAVFESGGEDLEQIAAMGSGTITFTCPDPYKYGLHYNYSVGDALDYKTITNNGSAPIQPLFIVNFQKDANYFAIAGPDGLVQYGAPAGVEQPTVKPLERVLTDYCWDLAPWSSTGLNLDFGIATGSFQVTDGHKFTVANWGDDDTTKSAWHGPVLRRSIPESVQDFRAIFDIDLNNPPKTAGRVEMWLLDAAGAIVGRMIFWDRYLNAEKNEAVIAAGPNGNSEYVLEHGGFPSSKSLTWNGSFKGRLVLNRQGNDWRASVQKLVSGNRLSEASKGYGRLIRSANNNPIAQIQIGIRKYGNSPSFYAAIRDIAIERINKIPDKNTIPTIFRAGDVLEIDFTTGSAFLNGEYFNQQLDPASRFFSIPPGLTDLKFLTTDPTGVQISLDYDERYK